MTGQTPGQLALGFDYERLAVTGRRRPRRKVEAVPELDLGPLVRVPRAVPGPVWARFFAIREDLG